ncbi:MAG TPA: ABC transporter ATP-binding protein [Acidimicrobiales bacterium]|nr:ABC transporter ATP-binding protein [Acidimicrobiales bacterium]
MNADALLQVQDATVQFGGVNALNAVSLQVPAGSITGLIGPNGAGKTTCFNVITGLQETVAGRIQLDGVDVSKLGPHKRARMGLARTFQRLEVFGSLSARENVLVAAEIRQSWSKEKADPGDVADELLERVGISNVAHDRVDAMPTGLARLVELARALAARPRVLLLDEPGSGLDDTETESFANLLVELAGEGLGILIVEHDVELVMRVCKHIFVLDFGAIIADGNPKQIQAHPAVQAAYLGTAPA